MEEKLKVGDKVIVTSNLNDLNKFMKNYTNEVTFVTEVLDTDYGQIVKLEIDCGIWFWYYERNYKQINLI